jgi:hypothetical protein
VVADLLQDLSERIKALAGDWTKYTIVGSFLLYLVGYLALRFHLTTLGISTDLAVLDERYLFAGARFFVYLVSSVPNIVLVALPIALVAWAAFKFLPDAIGARVEAWITQPTGLTVFGLVFAVVAIQFVMRQCFVFSDLLLAESLPAEPAWLVKLLLDDRLMPLYFSLLTALCAVTLAILVALRKAELQGAAIRFGWALLAFLAAVQILLLPINYGVLIIDKTLPRVAGLGDKPLAEGEEAWLVWEGKDGVTFLVRKDRARRALVTLPRAELKRTEIIGFDRILPKLFREGNKG